MVDIAAAALRHIAASSPAGAIIASVIVALALVLIVAAWSLGIFDDRRNAQQRTDFQDRLLKAIDVLTASERDLRRENEALRDKLDRLEVQIDLMREQGRRSLEMLRAVAGRRDDPAAVGLPDEPGRAA